MAVLFLIVIFLGQFRLRATSDVPSEYLPYFCSRWVGLNLPLCYFAFFIFSGYSECFSSPAADLCNGIGVQVFMISAFSCLEPLTSLKTRKLTLFKWGKCMCFRIVLFIHCFFCKIKLVICSFHSSFLSFVV